MATASFRWNTIKAASGNYSRTVNLLSAFQSGQFTTVQCVQVDNRSVPYAVQLVSQESGQRIIVAAFTLGQYPLICGPAPQVTVTMTALASLLGSQIIDACTTTLQFFNVYHGSFEYKANSVYGDNFFQVPGQVTLASVTSQTMLPALGSNQHYLLSQLSLTIGQLTAFAAGTGYQVIMTEEGNSGPFVLWFDDGFAPAGQTAISYQRTIAFPTPILTTDPLNRITLQSNVFPAPLGFICVFQLLFGVVTIT